MRIRTASLLDAKGKDRQNTGALVCGRREEWTTHSNAYVFLGLLVLALRRLGLERSLRAVAVEGRLSWAL